MKISFCTVVSNRLHHLKVTLPHNLKYIEENISELCVLAYNDPTVKVFLEEKYKEYLDNGMIKVREVNDGYIPKDGSSFACGYVKQHSHNMGSGEILFNLDADNFIDDELMKKLEDLKENQILIIDPRTNAPDGRSGRIGIYRKNYYLLGGYRDKGRSDDVDFCTRAVFMRLRVVYHNCNIKPLSND